MNDLINRQTAINIISDIMRVLNELPSAESERKHGEWIYDGN